MFHHSFIEHQVVASSSHSKIEDEDANDGESVETNTLAQHVVPCPLRIEARPGPVKDVVVCPL